MRECLPDPWIGYPTIDIHTPWRLESRRSGRRYVVRRERFLPSDLEAGRRHGVLCEAWRLVALKRIPGTRQLREVGLWGGEVHAHGFRCVAGARRGERRLYEPTSDAPSDWFRAEASALVAQIEAARLVR